VATSRCNGEDVPFPIRGIPGDWKDCWDDPDDSAELRARAEAVERRHARHAAVLGVVWQGEIRAERARKRRGRRG
jgi:hypothetical protein